MNELGIILLSAFGVFAFVVLVLAGKDLCALIGQWLDDIYQHLRLWYIGRWMQFRIFQQELQVRYAWDRRLFVIRGYSTDYHIPNWVAVKWYQDGAEMFTIEHSALRVYPRLQRKRDGKIYQ